MRKTMIQIYEVQKPAEAEALIELGVDRIGSVLPDPAKWKSASVRKTVQAARQGGAASVLIPLMKDPAAIFAALDYYEPDCVHLCDVLLPWPDEKQVAVRDFDALLSLHIDIRDRFPRLDIMRSLSVPRFGLPVAAAVEKNILDMAERFSPVTDFFLIDTLLSGADQPVAGFVGITGETCDWTIAKTVINRSPIPVILAGGLAADNVYEAVTGLRPAGVDSCTRTNATDRSGRPIRFKKDLKKVRRFIEEVRRADLFLEGLSHDAAVVNRE
ncbi:MAG TPA: hypothetical protein P5208_05980 [Smithellaceae bacterium]|nr:hypothetical protein [Smithellaceae bacterium]HRV44836.1 hypothetical protein [Smithellaceae bacterium]